jgi:hypothetical protein
MIVTQKIGGILKFHKEETNRDTFYDLGKKMFFKENKDGERVEISYPQGFFSGYSVGDIIDGFENEKYGKFLKKISEVERRCTNVGTILSRANHRKYSNYEQYIAIGIDIKVDSYVRVITEYDKDSIAILKQFGYSNSSEKILEKDYSKKIFTYLLNCTNDGTFQIEDVKELFDSVGGNFYSRGMQIRELCGTYSYEYKALANYIMNIYRYEKTSMYYIIEYLYDYARMSYGMSGNLRFDKYPKYLKVIHDIVVFNYNKFKTTYDDELFANSVSLYKKLEYSSDTYSIICPEKSGDMKKEGTDLHHCVASYIKTVMESNSNILFLRKTKTLDKSLVTIEVKNGTVTHCRGLQNRVVSKEEDKFIAKWAKSKGLIYIGKELNYDE